MCVCMGGCRALAHHVELKTTHGRHQRAEGRGSLSTGASWGGLGASWSCLGASWADLGLPFPLPPALDHPARRILQTSFSTPYRTSTSLNLTPLNSTQLTSLFDLLGLHFGASWPPQIDPRSTQDRSKSPLEALLFQKREFSRNIGGRNVSGVFWAPRRHPKRPKTAPRRS